MTSGSAGSSLRLHWASGSQKSSCSSIQGPECPPRLHKAGLLPKAHTEAAVVKPPLMAGTPEAHSFSLQQPGELCHQESRQRPVVISQAGKTALPSGMCHLGVGKLPGLKAAQLLPLQTISGLKLGICGVQVAVPEHCWEEAGAQDLSAPAPCKERAADGAWVRQRFQFHSRKTRVRRPPSTTWSRLYSWGHFPGPGYREGRFPSSANIPQPTSFRP